MYRYLVIGAYKSISNKPLSEERVDGDRIINLMISLLKSTRSECVELGCGCQKKCIRTIEQELGVMKGTLSKKGKLQTFIDVVRRKIRGFRIRHNPNANESGLYYNETRN